MQALTYNRACFSLLRTLRCPYSIVRCSHVSCLQDKGSILTRTLEVKLTRHAKPASNREESGLGLSGWPTSPPR
jgi:hypothetical protein